MTGTENFPTAESALEYRRAHDLAAKALNRSTRAQLEVIDRAEMQARGMDRIYGRLSKDELISDILGMRYPTDRLNEAIHVQAHQPGQPWDGCEWCSVHPTDDLQAQADSLSDQGPAKVARLLAEHTAAACATILDAQTIAPLNGCTCGGIGRTGSHFAGCPWAPVPYSGPLGEYGDAL